MTVRPPESPWVPIIVAIAVAALVVAVVALMFFGGVAVPPGD